MTAYNPSEWSDLFVAAAGASGALTGLVFVAVSINLDQIIEHTGLPDRALETLTMLLSVLVVALIGLIPGQSNTALGIELTAESLIALSAIVVLARRGLAGAPRGTRTRSWLASRAVLISIATIPFVIGGLTLLAESGGGLYWTAAGLVGATAAAVLNAWVLLVEIRR